MVHISNGNKPAGLAYVENVVDAIVLSLKNKRSIGQAYNISDGSDISFYFLFSLYFLAYLLNFIAQLINLFF